jgi:hypothetical protein
LVVSFGRCKFRLCLAFVGRLLQAIIGGQAIDLKVLLLHGRVFRFSVFKHGWSLHLRAQAV